MAFASPRLVDAGIISTSGAVNNNGLFPNPTDLTKNALATPNNAQLFIERQDFTLTEILDLDVTGTGSHTNHQTISQLAAGSRVDTYFLHYDVLNTGTGSVSGVINFDRDIIGLQTRDGTLDAAHPDVGLSFVTYQTGSAFDGTFDSAADLLTISSDRRSLRFTLSVGSAVDTVRIVTTPTPEPSSLALLGLGGLGLCGWRHKRKTTIAA